MVNVRLFHVFVESILSRSNNKALCTSTGLEGLARGLESSELGIEDLRFFYCDIAAEAGAALVLVLALAGEQEEEGSERGGMRGEQ